jgi:hypothetical protein
MSIFSAPLSSSEGLSFRVSFWASKISSTVLALFWMSPHHTSATFQTSCLWKAESLLYQSRCIECRIFWTISAIQYTGILKYPLRSSAIWFADLHEAVIHRLEMKIFKQLCPAIDSFGLYRLNRQFLSYLAFSSWLGLIPRLFNWRTWNRSKISSLPRR